MKIVHFSSLDYIPASHENKKTPEVWKKVLLTHSDLISGKVQMVNWAKLPKGNTFEAHYHESMEEIFIILSGKARVRGGGKEAILEKSDVVVIPPKMIHDMKNISDQDVEYLVIGITNASDGNTIVV